MVWRRSIIAATLFLLWLALSMSGASPNTSWEHHPFAGPFIFLHHWRTSQDTPFGLALLLAVLLPAVAWVKTSSAWALVATLIAVGFSIGVSVFAAASAAC
jgi:hypothetical protein